jgi:hypothetical protein
VLPYLRAEGLVGNEVSLGCQLKIIREGMPIPSDFIVQRRVDDLRATVDLSARVNAIYSSSVFHSSSVFPPKNACIFFGLNVDRDIMQMPGLAFVLCAINVVAHDLLGGAARVTDHVRDDVLSVRWLAEKYACDL